MQHYKCGCLQREAWEAAPISCRAAVELFGADNAHPMSQVSSCNQLHLLVIVVLQVLQQAKAKAVLASAHVQCQAGMYS